MRTVVINNCSRLEICQLPPKTRGVGGYVPGDILTLVPGANLVPSREHDEAMKNPGWAAKFKTKIEPSRAPEHDTESVGKPMLQVAAFLGEKGNGQVEDKSPLVKLTPEQCQLLINETFTQDLLKQWNAEEVRPDIRRAISDQLARLAEGDKANPATAGR